MREVKFRAFDRKKRKIFPIHQMQFGKIDDQLTYISGVDIHDKDSDCDGDVFYGGNIHKMTGQPPLPRFELMQYTGLKDKNGVEIFEGEILKAATGLAGSVYWDEKEANYRVKLPDVAPQLYIVHRWFEVTGSIYENPELLNGGDTDATTNV